MSPKHNRDMTKAEILEQMDRLGFTRQSLAEATGYKYEYIRDRLTPTAPEPSAKFVASVQRVFSEEERRREVDLTKPGSSVWDLVYFNGMEIDRIDRAKRAAGYTELKTFYRDAIIDFADGILNAEKSLPDTIITFPETPLFHAAAGLPIDSDADTYAPTRDIGPGRFAVQLHGDSMAPRFPDNSIVIMRERSTLKRPTLKKGEIYLFLVDGEKTVKVYGTRPATPDEIEAGMSYTSKTDGTQKVALLKSLNPDYPDIVAKEPIDWIGWLDKADN